MPADSQLPTLRISLVTPVFNTDPQMLRECIESVLHQTYPTWQLVLVDDASTDEGTLDVLRHYDWFEDRITVVTRETNGGISQASNDGLAAATGEFVGLLDHDDVLDLEALGMVAHVTATVPGVHVIYSDEDKFERLGHNGDAYFKPDWAPDILLTQNYVSHLTVYRKAVVDRVGGFRLGFEGSQDWDLLLRVTELTQAVHHIPHVLYHWRAHAGSTARTTEAKPYAAVAAERALTEALARRKIDGRVEFLPELGYFQVRRTIKDRRLVSVVIPTAGGSRELAGERTRLIDRVLTGLRDNTDYRELEIVVVLSAGVPAGLADELRPLVGDIPIRFLESQGRFSFSDAVNRGALASTGELLLLLNDDVEPINSEWLTLLVEALEDPTVGAAGPRLLFENGTIQHAGVVHHNGMPIHLQRGDPDGPGYFGEVALTRNYLAVTGACLLTPRATFLRVGGLSPIFPINYNDIDYCLKLAAAQLKSLYIGASKLYHYESSSREPTVTVHEVADYERYWHDLVMPDPYLARTRAHSSL